MAAILKSLNGCHFATDRPIASCSTSFSISFSRPFTSAWFRHRQTRDVRHNVRSWSKPTYLDHIIFMRGDCRFCQQDMNGTVATGCPLVYRCHEKKNGPASPKIDVTKPKHVKIAPSGLCLLPATNWGLEFPQRSPKWWRSYCLSKAVVKTSEAIDKNWTILGLLFIIGPWRHGRNNVTLGLKHLWSLTAVSYLHIYNNKLTNMPILQVC